MRVRNGDKTRKKLYRIQRVVRRMRKERSEVVPIRVDTRQEFIFIRLNNSTVAPYLMRLKVESH